MSKTLLLGGGGFIGANLCRILQDRALVVLDNFSHGDRTNIPTSVTVVEGDIRDQRRLYQAMRDVDSVVHLAAFGSVVESVDDPVTNFDINVRGTFDVLEACRRRGVERVIFASTGGALIGDAPPPVDEESLPSPLSPYGASKLCGEAYVHAYARSYGLRTIALRFANVYGPFSWHKHGAIPNFIKAVLSGEPMNIYGNGSATRDYIYVDDLCAGIKSALTADLVGGTVLHLATGVETGVADLSEIIRHVSGHLTHPVTHLPGRRAEVERNFARPDRARRQLGFKPAFDLVEGMARTWAWFENYHRTDAERGLRPC